MSNDLTNIESDIRAVIENHLPEYAAKMVREKLVRLEELEKSVEKLAQKLDDANRELGEVTQERNRMKQCVAKEDDLFKREKELEAKLRDIEQGQKIADLKATHAEQRVADYREMFSLVFRNIEVRRELHTSRLASSSVPVYDAASGHQTHVVQQYQTPAEDHETIKQE